MRWVILLLATSALLCAVMSVWIAASAAVPLVNAINLAIIGTLVAVLSAGLAGVYAAWRRRLTSWLTLTVLAALFALSVAVTNLPELDQFQRPFCSRVVAVHGGYVCVPGAPLAVNVFSLAPISILPIAALLSTFWRRKENTAVMAGPTA